LESFHGDALIVCLKENGGSLDEDVLFRKYQDYINLPMALNKIPTLAKSIPILSPLSQIYELFQFDTVPEGRYRELLERSLHEPPAIMNGEPPESKDDGFLCLGDC
jgi:hypothetical protein